MKERHPGVGSLTACNVRKLEVFLAHENVWYSVFMVVGLSHPASSVLRAQDRVKITAYYNVGRCRKYVEQVSEVVTEALCFTLPAFVTGATRYAIDENDVSGLSFVGGRPARGMVGPQLQVDVSAITRSDRRLGNTVRYGRIGHHHHSSATRPIVLFWPTKRVVHAGAGRQLVFELGERCVSCRAGEPCFGDRHDVCGPRADEGGGML